MSQKPVLNNARRILIVDDEPDFRNLLSAVFRRKGYQVLTASSGSEAFATLKDNPVDVVVSDIRMPNGDGVQLLDNIRTAGMGMPIVLLMTGYAEITTDEAYHHGAEALFSKPFDRKTLEQTIDRLLIPPEERWSQYPERVDTKVEVELHAPGIDGAIHAQVLNLGRGGMFIALPNHRIFNVAETIDFKLIFTGQNPLCGCGVVRWARIKEENGAPSGCGVEFTYLTEDDRARVLELINSAQPKSYIPKS